MSSTRTPMPSGSSANIPVLMVALLTAIFAFQLNASMLSPVLATMEDALNATTTEIGLTQTAFFASAALFSLFLPRWGDLVGRKKILMGMLGLAAVGSVVAALAPNVHVLAIGRVIQGACGPVVPMALIMLRVEVPDNQRYAKLMAVLTAVNGGIAGVDALAGGWLAQYWGFRAVFWVMTIMALLALVAIAFGAGESRSESNVKMDWPGAALLVVVLAGFYFALGEAGELAAANWWAVLALVIVAVVAFMLFWRREQTTPQPMVSTTYLKERRTWALLSTTLLTMTGVFAVMNGLIPNLAQDPAMGAALSAGSVSYWTLTPYAIAGLIMGPIAGQLAARMGYRGTLQAGLLLTIVCLLAAAWLVTSLGPLVVLLVSIALGLTYSGTCNIMLNGLGIVLSPKDNQGYLPGMNAGAFNLGAGLSFAVLFAVQDAFEVFAGTVAGYRFGMLAGAALMVLAFFVSLLIPRPVEGSDSAADDAHPAESQYPTMQKES